MTRRRALVVPWSELARWDLKSARAAEFRAAHPGFVPLRHYAEDATVLVNPVSEPERLWPVYGVNNKTGVQLSHDQLGAEFNAPYKRIRQDWFFHNPTRANVGSLGRVPKVPPDALTSPEYQVWRLRPNMLPAFAEILIKLPFFRELIEVHRVGAVKERLFVENLLEIPVPPISLAGQQSVIDLWDRRQKEFSAAREGAKRRREQLNVDLARMLGLELSSAPVEAGAFRVNWSTIERWGVPHNRLKRTAADLSRGIHPVRELGTLITFLQYGSSEKASLDADGVPLLRMNNIVDGEINYSDLKYLSISNRDLKRIMLEDGDILFNRTNSKELVGKCAVFHGKRRFTFASYLIRFRVDRDVADPDFVSIVLNSQIGRSQIKALCRPIIGQANINSEELRSLNVPLPTLSAQKSIAGSIGKARVEIAKTMDEIARAEGDLLKHVQAEIFSVVAGRD